MSKNLALMAMLLSYATPIETTRARSKSNPSARDQRTQDDIDERERKRQEKLARRARRHAAEANNERGEG